MMKLLIVDNDPLMRDVIRTVVSKPGDEVEECADGDEVIGAFELFKPDWVLMDVHMPVMNGIAATRELKNVHPQARVAIVSNYGSLEFRESAAEAGAEKYFLKDNLSVIRPSLEQL